MIVKQNKGVGSPCPIAQYGLAIFIFVLCRIPLLESGR